MMIKLPVINFDNNHEMPNFSKNYLILKLVNDSNCYYNVKTIMISKGM